MVKLYRKKPVEVNAIQWDGINFNEIEDFCNYDCFLENYELKIGTLEGVMNADIGDYIIEGIQGENYPCKPDIFFETYEEVDNAE